MARYFLVPIQLRLPSRGLDSSYTEWHLIDFLSILCVALLESGATLSYFPRILAVLVSSFLYSIECLLR